MDQITRALDQVNLHVPLVTYVDIPPGPWLARHQQAVSTRYPVRCPYCGRPPDIPSLHPHPREFVKAMSCLMYECDNCRLGIIVGLITAYTLHLPIKTKHLRSVHWPTTIVGSFLLQNGPHHYPALLAYTHRCGTCTKQIECQARDYELTDNCRDYERVPDFLSKLRDLKIT